ncbi:hypothetical protein HMPREF9621_02802 [Cutibacterium modestum HL037PA2]|nr:hypothetical protein HMPREF9621_02802 [Cutibacterium modestum HL037PA2]
MFEQRPGRYSLLTERDDDAVMGSWELTQYGIVSRRPEPGR